MLLVHCSRNLRCLPEEVKVLAHFPRADIVAFEATAKGIVIEGILALVELITESIICVLEIKSLNSVSE